MRLLVCGDRNWTSYDVIKTALGRAHHNDPITELIEGGARGADTLARKAAEELGIPVTEVEAEWFKYGRGAGPIRNRKMLDMNPDAVLAFHNDYANSKGTKDCVEEAKRRGIRTMVLSLSGEEGKRPDSATPAQVNYIYRLARRNFMWNEEDVDAHILSTYDGKNTSELTKRQASELIEQLKGHVEHV